MDTLFMALMLNDSGSGATPGVGPTGAPYGGGWEGYGAYLETEQLLRVTWTNEDASAYTRVYNGSTLIDSAALPGATSLDTTITAYASYTINIKHYKNGIESLPDIITAGYLA